MVTINIKFLYMYPILFLIVGGCFSVLPSGQNRSKNLEQDMTINVGTVSYITIGTVSCVFWLYTIYIITYCTLPSLVFCMYLSPDWLILVHISKLANSPIVQIIKNN